jgi:hypothetical protein
MNLGRTLDPGAVLPALTAGDKEGVIRELAQTLLSRRPELDVAAVVTDVIERESLATTGVGDGVAIPQRPVAPAAWWRWPGAGGLACLVFQRTPLVTRGLALIMLAGMAFLLTVSAAPALTGQTQVHVMGGWPQNRVSQRRGLGLGLALFLIIRRPATARILHRLRNLEPDLSVSMGLMAATVVVLTVLTWIGQGFDLPDMVAGRFLASP